MIDTNPTTQTPSTQNPTMREELSQIDFSGTIWFSAALLASATVIAGLLSHGWRPSELPEPEQAIWWIGAVLVVVGIACLAWAGCPVLGGPLPREFKWKARSVRAGLAIFAAGAVIGVFAVLASPVIS